MRKIAIFVDAGYLYAQGSTALTGKKQERRWLRLHCEPVIQALKDCALRLAPDAYLLRVYWYDALLNHTPSLEQRALARLPDVKLRLGFVNSEGKQKGVDTLIVTDMVELARNHAITDALLLSGDEDVRIGVEIAQSYGGARAPSGSSSRTGISIPSTSGRSRWPYRVVPEGCGTMARSGEPARAVHHGRPTG